jgi:hypothetical protein
MFWIKLPFIETVFTSSTETCLKGQRSGLLALLILIHFTTCGISRRGINRSSHKKKALITTIMEVFSNILR